MNFEVYKVYFPNGHNIYRRNGNKPGQFVITLTDKSGNPLQTEDVVDTEYERNHIIDFKMNNSQNWDRNEEVYGEVESNFPSGMKVSLDNHYFVEYSKILENSINTESDFVVEAKNSESKIKSIKTYLFNSFLDKTMKSPLKIFLSYAHEDFKIKERVLTYLKPLLRENKVEIWHDSMIRPGDDWDDEVQTSLDQCDIYLLLISPDSIASDYIIFKELQIAYQKNKRILGFLISDCDWLSIALKVESDQTVMLCKIQIFPHKEDAAISPKTDDVALSELLALERFSNVSSAYMQIVKELKIIYDKY